MSGSVHKVKEWIDKHAAVIDPHTQSLLRKELEDELKKVEKPRRKVKTSMKELPNGDLQLENGTTIPAEKRQPCIKRDALGRFMHTTGGGRYCRVSRGGRNLEKHRIVWENAHGPIPEGFCIHHLNRDKKDNRLENLVIVTYAEHNRIHIKDRPIWNAGVTRETSPKWDAAIKEIMRTATVRDATRCNTTLDLYRQGLKVTAIATKLGICTRQVYTRLHIAGVGAL